MMVVDFYYSQAIKFQSMSICKQIFFCEGLSNYLSEVLGKLLHYVPMSFSWVKLKYMDLNQQLFN